MNMDGIERNIPGNQAEAFQFGDFTLRLNPHQLLRNGQAINLSLVDLKVLEVLVRRPGETLSRDYLLNQARGADVALNTNRIDKSISDLRKGLSDQPRSPLFIETVHGFGYRFKVQPAARPATQEMERTGPTLERRVRWAWGVALTALIGLGFLWAWQARPQPAPRFSAAVSIVPDHPNSSAEISIVAAVVNTTKVSVGPVIVTVEAYNSSDQRLLKKEFPSASFLPAETKSFSFRTTLPAGQIRFALGIFGRNQPSTYFWKENLRTILVK